MRLIERSTNKLNEVLSLPSPDSMSEHDKLGVRAVSLLAVGSFAAFAAISGSQFVRYITNLETIMPVSTESSALWAHAAVDFANLQIAQTYIGTSLASTALAVVSGLTFNDIRKRHAANPEPKAREA